MVDFEQPLTWIRGIDHKGSERGNIRVLALGMLEVDDAVKQWRTKAEGQVSMKLPRAREVEHSATEGVVMYRLVVLVLPLCLGFSY